MSNKQTDIFLEAVKEAEEEKEARMEKICRAFGWKYFKKAKPFKFTINDVIAQCDSVANEQRKFINHLKYDKPQ